MKRRMKINSKYTITGTFETKIWKVKSKKLEVLIKKEIVLKRADDH